MNKVNHGKTGGWPSFAACDDNMLKSIHFLHSTILPATQMATHENSWTVILDRVDEALVSALMVLQSFKMSLLLRFYFCACKYYILNICCDIGLTNEFMTCFTCNSSE